MNSYLLIYYMKNNGDSFKTLAQAIKCSRWNLFKKMKGIFKEDFTMQEISIIKERYCLNAKQTMAVFFS